MLCTRLTAEASAVVLFCKAGARTFGLVVQQSIAPLHVVALLRESFDMIFLR